MAKSKLYWAGGLFSLLQLQGNHSLSRFVNEIADDRYDLCLPQDLDFSGVAGPKDIRDLDFCALLTSQIAVFSFDGSELDSGTLVEFIIAKVADIPAVVIRSDFRSAGDNAEAPWNLMAHGYPRTETVLLHAMVEYGAALKATGEPGQAIDSVLRNYAGRIVEALRKVEASTPLAAKPDLVHLGEWLPKCLDLSQGIEGDMQKAFSQRTDRSGLE